MATREQRKANNTVVKNMQWYQKSLMKAKALSFIDHEVPRWPPKSMGLGYPNCD